MKDCVLGHAAGKMRLFSLHLVQSVLQCCGSSSLIRLKAASCCFPQLQNLHAEVLQHAMRDSA